MKVALVHNRKFPVTLYGGTERVIWWLAKGLTGLGIDVQLICQQGSHCPFAEVIPFDFSLNPETKIKCVDLFHYFSTPDFVPQRPYVVTIEGNGKLSEIFLPNTVFVSRDHAQRHGAICFVYNGLDPDDYLYCESKEPYLIFLGKASWRVKNIAGAIRIARKSGRPLKVLGGSRLLFKNWRGISWQGWVGGETKKRLICSSSALLFPILWDEPFGIAIVEALVSGTPVLASNRGSIPELIGEGVGFICSSESDFLKGIERLDCLNPQHCRDWAVDRFHYLKMARSYLALYDLVLKGGSLNVAVPQTQQPTCFPNRVKKPSSFISNRDSFSL